VKILVSESLFHYQVEAEAAAVKAVAKELCPLEIILDRVLLTSTGVLLGCWKVFLLLSLCFNKCESDVHFVLIIPLWEFHPP